MTLSFFMYMILILSTLMALSSTNWLMIWFCMEINLFSFIPILMQDKLSHSNESTIIYFMSQSVGSSMMLMSSIIILNQGTYSKFMILILTFSLLLKLGSAPCHYWFPIVMDSCSWLNCFILSTWQKVAPLFIILVTLNSLKSTSMHIIIPLNAILGGIMGLYQISAKKIMAYSSITHLGWSLSGWLVGLPCISMAYFTMYSLVALPIFMFMHNHKISYIQDIWGNNYNENKEKIATITLMLMSLGGVPPLLGFLPKFLILYYIINTHMLHSIILLSGSILNLYFYMNMSMQSMTNNSLQNQKPWKMTSSMSTNAIMSTMSMTILGTTMFLL